ncbi:MAG: DNA recombination protein RmuC [Erysipelotrichaceae bacterium]
MEFILIALMIVILILLLVNVIITFNNKKSIAEEIRNQMKDNVSSMMDNTNHLSSVMSEASRNASVSQDKRIDELTKQLDANQKLLYQIVSDSLNNIQKAISENTKMSEQKLENIRITMEQRLTKLSDENSKKLDEMRETVDEKLQKTLEERISKSFTIVSERLEQVYKGLGEMQTLAIGVGDLKKVLSNVKTRGILGEIQLGAILEEILSPEQYDTNVVTKKGSSNYVEYAVKLPGDDEHVVYLPIDSKFPGETYSQLVDAYDSGDTARIAICVKALETVIKQSAKDIRDKYIDTPNTTDFAIMFLPFEGLYAEVINRGLIEVLQRDYKINIAGPTTMAALLNSLQMGFKTLAIQKRSSEVWDVLGAVKTEFNKFGEVLEGTQLKMEQAQRELDKLVGVRTRQIQKKLKDVTSLEVNSTEVLIEDGEDV